MPIDFFPMIMSAINKGMDPVALINQYIGQDPRARQAMQMIRGKSPAQLKQMAENMAKERGTTVNQIAQSLGIKM